MLLRLSVVPLLLGVTSVPAADPPNPARAAAKVKEVIGHMGSCADRPGNTLVSIRRAIEAGAHVAEVDVRTTKDGVLVCMHDPDVDRTTDGKGKVADLTLADVQRLDAGRKFDAKFAGERVPTLRDVLALGKGKIGIMLDLKEEARLTRSGSPPRCGGTGSRTERSSGAVRRAREAVPQATPGGPADRADSHGEGHRAVRRGRGEGDPPVAEVARR